MTDQPEPLPTVPRSAFRDAVDAATGGCGCACHTGVGYNTQCEHCALVPLPSRSMMPPTVPESAPRELQPWAVIGPSQEQKDAMLRASARAIADELAAEAARLIPDGLRPVYESGFVEGFNEGYWRAESVTGEATDG